MCLSSVYKDKIDDSTLLMRNVASVKIDGDYIILIDLMEKEERIKGQILNINLLDNYVLVKTKD